MSTVEQIYATGSKVYVLCTVADATSSATDVDYKMKSYRGLFRASQVNDGLKRNPDGMKEEITAEVTAEVQATDLSYFSNFIAMTEAQITDCFGSTYTTLSGVINSGAFTMAQMITAYKTWNATTGISIGSVVTITATSATAVVINSWVADTTIKYSLLNTDSMTTTTVSYTDNAITATGTIIDVSNLTLSEIKAAVDAL